MSKITNITIAGLGGQGVLKSSDILAQVMFEAGKDVKKSEVHGMSQRGGSVFSEVRFGDEVFSPMVPQGESDFLVVLSEDQVEVNKSKLKQDGILITPSSIDESKLASKKCLNIALLGVLSKHLDETPEHWLMVIKKILPAKLHEMNVAAFELGRNTAD